ncbi:TetR/AcrR family transcriptional regulator [Micromonospora sp. HM5-17]|jgi:AcrR family transcriptional regulator|uniref:TetR/AcrR family transcriptional regulator n=1 Tax=Micromonospora sp. HM5-17 TaxID=2487710 RepID=UPI000F49652C|nr:TetR/AcrR family transcriptional regulator [Micromonospora sp. HM5-17]ROT32116.1 TetR/AcrR family transcriptional regulator [Micromonospora sp. HM5-17]
MTQAKTAGRPYHHGDLRRALLAAAAEAIEEAGPAALSLRDLARRAGVSHAAPAHHFGDKAGLLTAFAAEGFELLAAALQRIWAETGSLRELGVGYVRFAVDHRAHFEVMFRPDLYHRDDPEVLAAGRRARDALRVGVAAHRPGGDEAERVDLAAWSMVHGFATLWLGGAFSEREVGDDLEAAAREVIRQVL